MLGVDDAHLLDDLSATLLHQIAVGPVHAGIIAAPPDTPQIRMKSRLEFMVASTCRNDTAFRHTAPSEQCGRASRGEACQVGCHALPTLFKGTAASRHPNGCGKFPAGADY